jgi:prevent-host-death family protein
MKELILGVRELQAQLGLALRTAREGGRVVITSHNRPVANLVPPAEERLPAGGIEAKLRRMAREGRVRLGTISPMPDVKPVKFADLGSQVESDRR